MACLGSLPAFLCHVPSLKPDFHWIEALVLIKSSTQKSVSTHTAICDLVCQWVCVILRRLYDVAVLAGLTCSWRGIMAVALSLQGQRGEY